MAMEFFVFHVEAFQFSKFHENLGKRHKGSYGIQGQKFVKLMEKVG